MEAKNSRRKPTIELRYYQLPEHELALALLGQEWKRVYGTDAEDLHFHNLMEIGLCRWGEGTLIVDEEQYEYREGVVTLIPSNCLHTTLSRDHSLNQWEYLFLDPRQVMEKAFPNDAVFVEAVVNRLASDARILTEAENPALAQLIRLALDEYRAENAYRTEVVQGLLTSILMLVVRLFEGTGQSVHPSRAGLRQIMPAMEYISQAYMNPLSIQEVAAKCSLSEAHLRRKFKEYLHMSPNEYLTLVRIRHGSELLNTTNDSVMDVALQVGYQSASSFDRNFQKLLGVTPYQYKKNGKDYKGKLLEYKITAKKGWKTLEDV